MFRLSLLGLFLLWFLASCSSPGTNTAVLYETNSDSARYYFQLGWEEILDKGRWTASEAAFRKVVEFDPDFLVGQSLVGRISASQEEREAILARLEQEADQLGNFDRLLVDIFRSNIELMNRRGSSTPATKEQVQSHYQLACTNLRQVLNRFPNEPYLRAEYIEYIHALQGAQAALDSITQWPIAPIPFLLSYSAQMEAELGRFEQALELARQFQQELNDESLPQAYTVFAQVYLEMDSLDQAKNYAEKAVELDPKHLIAQGLLGQIEQAMSND